jgi:hypothetical protein
MIEVCQFAVLLVLYVLAVIRREGLKITTYEIVFCAYATGWILEEFAAIIEHGWKVHTQNLWSFLDITFFLIYSTYFTIRMYALASGQFYLGEDALNISRASRPWLLEISPALRSALMGLMDVQSSSIVVGVLCCRNEAGWYDCAVWDEEK